MEADLGRAQGGRCNGGGEIAVGRIREFKREVIVVVGSAHDDGQAVSGGRGDGESGEHGQSCGREGDISGSVLLEVLSLAVPEDARSHEVSGAIEQSPVGCRGGHEAARRGEDGSVI